MTFDKAFLTLLRAATGEAWPDMMYDLGASPPGCEVDPPFDPQKCGFSDPTFKEGCTNINGCGDMNYSSAFWITFQVAVNFVMLNLIVFYILDSFDTTKRAEETQLAPHMEAQLLQEWSRFDAVHEGYLQIDEVVQVFRLLPQPMGLLHPHRHQDLQRQLKIATQTEEKMRRGRRRRVSIAETQETLLAEAFVIANESRPEEEIERMESGAHAMMRAQTLGTPKKSEPALGKRMSAAASMHSMPGLDALRGESKEGASKEGSGEHHGHHHHHRHHRHGMTHAAPSHKSRRNSASEAMSMGYDDAPPVRSTSPLLSPSRERMRMTGSTLERAISKRVRTAVKRSRTERVRRRSAVESHLDHVGRRASAINMEGIVAARAAAVKLRGAQRKRLVDGGAAGGGGGGGGDGGGGDPGEGGTPSPEALLRNDPTSAISSPSNAIVPKNGDGSFERAAKQGGQGASGEVEFISHAQRMVRRLSLQTDALVSIDNKIHTAPKQLSAREVHLSSKQATLEKERLVKRMAQAGGNAASAFVPQRSNKVSQGAAARSNAPLRRGSLRMSAAEAHSMTYDPLALSPPLPPKAESAAPSSSSGGSMWARHQAMANAHAGDSDGQLRRSSKTVIAVVDDDDSAAASAFAASSPLQRGSTLWARHAAMSSAHAGDDDAAKRRSASPVEEQGGGSSVDVSPRTEKKHAKKVAKKSRMDAIWDATAARRGGASGEETRRVYESSLASGNPEASGGSEWTTDSYVDTEDDETDATYTGQSLDSPGDSTIDFSAEDEAHDLDDAAARAREQWTRSMRNSLGFSSDRAASLAAPAKKQEGEGSTGGASFSAETTYSSGASGDESWTQTHSQSEDSQPSNSETLYSSEEEAANGGAASAPSLTASTATGAATTRKKAMERRPPSNMLTLKEKSALGKKEKEVRARRYDAEGGEVLDTNLSGMTTAEKKDATSIRRRSTAAQKKRAAHLRHEKRRRHLNSSNSGFKRVTSLYNAHLRLDDDMVKRLILKGPKTGEKEGWAIPPRLLYGREVFHLSDVAVAIARRVHDREERKKRRDRIRFRRELRTRRQKSSQLAFLEQASGIEERAMTPRTREGHKMLSSHNARRNSMRGQQVFLSFIG